MTGDPGTFPEASPDPEPGVNLTRRVLSSTAALLFRSAWERLLSLVATLAVARLILPRDMGEASLALVVVALATILVDAGITTAMVKAEREPTEADFRAARNGQLLLAVVAVVLAALVVPFDPRFGWLVLVDSLQLLTDPLILERRVMLQREIDFRGLSLADGIGVLTRSVVSLAVAVLDRGPFCLIAGDLSAALVYAFLVVTFLKARRPAAGTGHDRPSLWSAIRHGLPFQWFNFIVNLRMFLSTTLIGGLVGLSALGLFQFAVRALSPVFLVFTSLQSLAVPVGVHVVADPGSHRRVREGYLIGGLATSVILAMAAAPARWLVPLLFGSRWDGSIPLLFSLGLAIVIFGPATSFGVGLIIAAGRARVATASAGTCTVFLLLSLFAFSRLGGLDDLGVAWVVSSVAETAVMVWGCHRFAKVNLVLPTLLPLPAYLVPFVIGRVAGQAAGGTWAAATVSVAATGAAAALVAGPIGWKPAVSLWRGRASS